MDGWGRRRVVHLRLKDKTTGLLFLLQLLLFRCSLCALCASARRQVWDVCRRLYLYLSFFTISSSFNFHFLTILAWVLLYVCVYVRLQKQNANKQRAKTTKKARRTSSRRTTTMMKALAMFLFLVLLLGMQLFNTFLTFALCSNVLKEQTHTRALKCNGKICTKMCVQRRKSHIHVNITKHVKIAMLQSSPHVKKLPTMFNIIERPKYF